MTAEHGEATTQSFDAAERVVRGGGVVIVATETFYGLAADPFNEEAVERIFRIKGRIAGKPLPLIASDRGALKLLSAVMTPVTEALSDGFWPGSLTIVLEIGIGLSPLLIGPEGKVGVRVPPICPARVLAERVGGLITATSANLSGGPDPDRVEKIAAGLIASVDLVMDSGPTPGGRPSTVVEPLGDECRVIREGAVPESVIIDFLRGRIRRKSS